MSSDQEYANFLEKANQDTGSSSNEVKSSGFAQTKAVDSAVPKSLNNVDAFYQSDTDEPFESVALKYGKKDSISQAADKFADLINHSGEVEEISVKDWNVKNHYAEVVEAVKEAGSDKADVQVFRVAHGSTRCEYYIVTLNDEGVIVGVKAKAVES
ncbi:hypothetical protein M436DRAFT_55197 [Aureobasidium namibiae CBS 147.97]|uniref:Uncharacterized protein n=1 Tax=Aureobasidium namibiae CBS 147.97 TaxID=1043004 RepID=A0A074W9J8_9PEZI|nr:uncharacterized protein M436DRAFT_55197 [Aureobasidium namibiae CBS 147.97]KEQ69770.1 hypothetical protein M436DRAFT_55197 [Aureobasidium namibiae CBS 147.97]